MNTLTFCCQVLCILPLLDHDISGRFWCKRPLKICSNLQETCFTTDLGLGVYVLYNVLRIRKKYIIFLLRLLIYFINNVYSCNVIYWICVVHLIDLTGSIFNLAALDTTWVSAFLSCKYDVKQSFLKFRYPTLRPNDNWTAQSNIYNMDSNDHLTPSRIS